MRIQLPVRRLVILLALIAFALFLFLPLRLVLGAMESGLEAREASGSVWAGSLKEARIGPALLGDLDARLAPLPLLTGTARIRVERQSEGPDRLTGAFGVSRNRRSVESVTGPIPIDALAGALPIASFDLTDVTVRFRDGTCERAEGLVRANLSGDVGGLPLPAGLSGSVRCDRGALLLPLRSGSGAENVALRVFGDGRYEALVQVRASEPALVARLTGAGFVLGAGGYGMTLRGKL